MSVHLFHVLSAQTGIKLLQFIIFIYYTEFTSLISGLKQEFVTLSANKNRLKTNKQLGHVTTADKTVTVKLQVDRQLHWIVLRVRKLDSISNGIRPGTSTMQN